MSLWALGQGWLSGLFQTQEQLSDRDIQRGIRMFTVDGMCSMAMAALQGGPFLAALALAIGASNYEIGLLAAVGFITQPMQLVGLYLVKRFRRRRAITALCAVVSRLSWLPIILIPVLFVNRGASFLVQWLLLSALVASIPGPAWNSLVRDLVPLDVFGRVTSRRTTLGTGLALALILLGGFFVDWWRTAFPESQPASFSLLFLCGLGFGMAGIYAISRLPEPEMATHEDTPLRDLLVMPLKDQNYRKLLYFMAAWNFALNLATPFFVVYMLRRIGVSMTMVTVLTVSSQLANLFFLRIWGRLADRFSNKSVLSVSGPLFLAAVVGWSFTTMPERYFLTVPPLGGVVADFFAVRELALSMSWSDPSRQISIYALNFRSLDFVFLLAFGVGLYALHRLAHVTEEGEVEEKEVVEELKNEVVSPIRTVSSIGGIRRFAFLPVHRLTGRSREPDA